MSTNDPQASAAAATIVMADVAGGAPLLLLVRRAEILRFAPGAYAFPGGRVEPQDRTDMAGVDGDGDDLAARSAALRELREETGVALDLGPETLVPFARWCPPVDAEISRRFDTRFYLARASDPVPPQADGTETADAFWATAAEILRRCETGDGHAIFPTRRMLERLAAFDSFAAARADAQAFPERIITPWVESGADGDWICIPEDAGYPICRERLGRARRG